MTSSKANITLIGLGNMGAAVGHAFLEAGRRLTVWNRTTSRTSVVAIVKAGAVLEPDLAKAIAANTIIIFCVLDYSNIYQGVEPLASSGVLKEKIVVNLTNGTAQDARDMAKWFHEHGVSKYFDGGIMVTPQNVGSDVAIVLASGENEESFAEAGVKDVLGIIGAPHYKGPDFGAAAGFDLALLAGMYGMFSGVLTALALIQRQLDRQKQDIDKVSGEKKKTSLQQVVAEYFNPLLQALVPYNEHIAKAIDEGDLDNNFGNPMEMQRVAIQNIIRGCQEEGVDGESLRYFAGLMEKVVMFHGADTGISRIHFLFLKE